MAKKICFFLVSCVIVFLFLEGLSSSVYVCYKLFSRSETPPSAYTRYDKDLGWVSSPNYYKKDFYDPGVYLRTNSQGFRNNEDFTVKAPPGKLRIICSGDSMTFGSGVDNDDTWCQLLEAMDHRLQTVNMAQAGYGVDQMYLWYRRAGAVLDHDVQIFAFVTDDFRRMQLKVFSGYGKPILRINNGEMVAGNVPVAREPPFFHWWALHSPQLMRLKSLAALARVFEKISVGKQSAARLGGAGEDQRFIIAKIIETLQAANKQKHSTLIFVYLPTRREYQKDETILAWRKFLQEETAKRGVVFIDLIEDFQKMPLAKMEKLFICSDSSQYFSNVEGHLTEEGNEYTAKQLYEKLISIPEIASKLTSITHAGEHHAADEQAALRTGKSAASR